MHVVKRDGTREEVSFDKVLLRLRNLCETTNLPPLRNVSYDRVAQQVLVGIYDGVHTSQLDDLAAEKANAMIYEHPEYDLLASRIAVSNHHKNVIHWLWNHFRFLQGAEAPSLEEIQSRLLYFVTLALYQNVNEVGERAPLISPRVFGVIGFLRDALEGKLSYLRDFNFSYRSFSTLQNDYLLKCHLYTREGKRIWVPVEYPQHSFLRITLGVHLGERYFSWEERRVDHHSLWKSFSEGLKTKLPGSTWREQELRLQREGTLDWKEILELVRSHTSLEEFHSFLKARGEETLSSFAMSSLEAELREEFKKKRLTWEELLDLELQGLEKEEFQEEVFTSLRDYENLSRGYYIYATPTLHNSGTLRPSDISCFLPMVPSDSMRGIYKWISDSAEISRVGGGIGSNVHNIRPRGAYISGTNGHSNGLVPLLRVVDATSVYVDQGGNKRPGSHAIYVEPWIGDIEEVLDLKRPLGLELKRARHLFYALWMPDEFWRTLQQEIRMKGEGKVKPELWYLMDPNQSPGLAETWDSGFSTGWLSDEEVEARREEFTFTWIYRSHVKAGRFLKRVSAYDLFQRILLSIMETGVPYILNKDSCNRKSNQQNLGSIRGSNLCTEIVEFSAPDEIAACNLSSICLPPLVEEIEEGFLGSEGETRPEVWETSLSQLLGEKGAVSQPRRFNWRRFEANIRQVVRNLNQVIDVNYYPLEAARRSNLRHRPIGIGVQGLADLFTLLRLPFDSLEANRLNFYLFETLYYISLEESSLLAREKRERRLRKHPDPTPEWSGSYESFPGSPLSKGVFQWELWVKEQKSEGKEALKFPLSRNWEGLREKVKRWGSRNSLLVAPMPTSSTSDITGNSPCIEPHAALFYKRKKKSSEQIVVNKFLIRDLMELGLWSETLQHRIQASPKCSISDIPGIPSLVKEIYKVSWDISMHTLIDIMLTRAPFVDQSQSFSWNVERPTPNLLSMLHLYAWRRGAKTNSYYTRQLARADARKASGEEERRAPEEGASCPLGAGPNCKGCGS